MILGSQDEWRKSDSILPFAVSVKFKNICLQVGKAARLLFEQFDSFLNLKCECNSTTKRNHFTVIWNVERFITNKNLHNSAHRQHGAVINYIGKLQRASVKIVMTIIIT